MLMSVVVDCLETTYPVHDLSLMDEPGNTPYSTKLSGVRL